jgi:hypothetical protein
MITPGRQEGTPDVVNIVTASTPNPPDIANLPPPDAPVTKLDNEVPDLVDEKEDEFVTDIPKPIRPSGHRQLAEFNLTESKSQNTAHDVIKAEDKKDNKTVYIKYAESRIAELEAAAAGAYKMLAPNHIPKTYAIDDDENDKCIGVASEEIPNFKSIAKDPLKAHELATHFLDDGVSIEELDQIDEQLYEAERKIENEEREILKQLAVLKEEEKELNEKRSQVRNQEDFVLINGEPPPNSDIEIIEIKKLRKENSKKTEELELKLDDLAGEIKKLRDDIYLSKKINFKDLECYRTVKSLALSLTTSYIFMEDDLHRNNFGKKGRLDFDMSFWPFFHDFKTKSLIARFLNLRVPGDHTTRVSAYDIIHFPNIDKCKPYFWPTQPPKTAALSSAPATAVKSKLNYPVNDYQTDDNKIFEALEHNPIFIYHKYAALTKLILTTPDVCRQNALQHISPETKYTFNNQEDYLINHFVKQHESRITAFRDVLLSIPEYREFFRKHHKKISAEFIRDLKNQNINYFNNKECEEKEIAATDVMEKQCNLLLQLMDVAERKEADDASSDTHFVPPTPEEKYNELDKLIRNAMETYKNPYNESVITGITTMFGWWRNHKTLATNIVGECDKFMAKNKESGSLDPSIYLLNIKNLSERINTELQPFEKANEENFQKTKVKEEPGGMHKTLLGLKEILDKTLANPAFVYVPANQPSLVLTQAN